MNFIELVNVTDVYICTAVCLFYDVPEQGGYSTGCSLPM